jgi:hypothetical protein
VTLWAMFVGKAPFRGTPAEVMYQYQHQHAPLPLEQLNDVPQPVLVLLEVLLQKDPRRRFQAAAPGGRPVPFGRPGLWLVLLQAGHERGRFVWG